MKTTRITYTQPNQNNEECNTFGIRTPSIDNRRGLYEEIKKGGGQ